LTGERFDWDEFQLRKFFPNLHLCIGAIGVGFMVEIPTTRRQRWLEVGGEYRTIDIAIPSVIHFRAWMVE